MAQSFEIHVIEDPTPSSPFYRDLVELYLKILDPARIAEMEMQLPTKRRSLLLVAREGDKPVGFKLGYEMRPDRYYSWLGGVDPNYRKRGVGKALMLAQHAWAKQQGYKHIETRTLNHWREMLVLNIRTGFNIVGSYVDGPTGVKIILERDL